MKHAVSLSIALLITVNGFAASASPRKTPHQNTTGAQIQQMSAELQELKTMVLQQQQRIDHLTQQLEQRDEALLETKAAANNAAITASSTQKLAADNAAAYSALNSRVETLQSDVTAASSGMVASEKKVQESQESPAAIHYKGVTITPGGFLAAESVYRSHGLLADVNTPINSIPFSGSGQSGLSEFFGSGRQSRISLLVEGTLKTAKLSGYFETDWLSAGVTSNNNQSNSYTNRQRQIWGQLALHSGFTFTGGQMWSLVTETTKGTDNRSEALPLTIDPQYTVGFSWARQFAFRAQKDFGNKVWLAFAVENPQALLGASGNTANFVLGGAGNTGGLYNSLANYSLNYTPDFIVKAAFEPGFGHYEIFGVLSNFRDRIYPNATAATPSAVGAMNSNLTGGGVGVNARVTLAKKVTLGLHLLGGNGIGRYGTSALPDVTVRPDGALTLLNSLQSLGTLEVHTKHWDWYFNYGGEYVGRSYNLNSAGQAVGYGSPLFNNSGCDVEALPTAASGFAPGSPSKCVGQTRTTQEGTVGFWFKPYSGPKGRIQFGPQYSYLVRKTWAAIGGQPQAVENMVFTSFRYYIP